MHKIKIKKKKHKNKAHSQIFSVSQKWYIQKLYTQVINQINVVISEFDWEKKN